MGINKAIIINKEIKYHNKAIIIKIIINNSQGDSNNIINKTICNKLKCRFQIKWKEKFNSALKDSEKTSKTNRLIFINY